MTAFADRLRACPLVAILRGIRPDEADAIGDALVETGFTIIEVPLNSPDPLASIGRLARRLDGRALVGAGTVLRKPDVAAVAQAGGRLIVMPHADGDVVREAKRLGLSAMPGFATPTEAFAMIAAGADALKLFPAEGSSPAVLKAMRAVLPPDMPILPVGGIDEAGLAKWIAAGAAGFGIGSSLYKPGSTAADVRQRGQAFIAALRAVRGS
jgi:2-dehydro-3-deoxyphosphogalactonate aldolase